MTTIGARLETIGAEIRKIECEIVACCRDDDISRRLITISGGAITGPVGPMLGRSRRSPRSVNIAVSYPAETSRDIRWKQQIAYVRHSQGGSTMPIFDKSALNRAEADLLRRLLGPAKPRDTSLRQASLAYHRRQRRAQITRGLIVLALIGSVWGLAFILSKNDAPSRVEARGLPLAYLGQALGASPLQPL